MSKKLLAALIALSMVGAYACDSDSDDGDGGATGDSCTATVCESGTLKVCVGNKVATTKACENGCAADGTKCADPSQPTPACTANACKDATTLNLCQGGTIIPTTCPAGCDTAANKCKENPNAESCTADACKDATVLKKCDGGKVLEVTCPNGCEANACKQAAPATCTKKAEDCGAGTKLDTAKCECVPDGGGETCTKKAEDCGAGTKLDTAKCECVPDGGGNDPKVGDDCDKTSYKKVCGSDGNSAYYCDKDGKVAKADCAGCTINAESNRYECADNRPDCTADSKEACKGACSADKKTGYFWNKELKTVDCSAKSDCTVDGTYVKCASAESASCEGKLDKGGKVGDDCDRNCYTQTCTNSGKNALVCWDDKVAEWTCATTCQDAGYDASKPLQVKCPKGGAETTGTPCKPGLTSKCDDACSEDKLTRWYWNGSEVKEKKCKEATCDPKDMNSCVAAGSGEELPACEKKDSGACTKCTPVCDGGKAYICNTQTNEMFAKDCINCKVEGISAICGSTGEKCGEDYVPSCDDDSKGKYCSKEEIKIWTCTKEGEKCHVSKDGTCSSSTSTCSNGKYDTTKYPNGYIECIK